MKLVKILSSLEGVNINFVYPRRDTVLHYFASKCVSTRSENKIVKIILAHPHVDINLRNLCSASSGGDTPLHIAVRNGNVEVVRMIMSHAKVDMNVLNADHKKPVALAALGHNKKIFEMLNDHRDVHIS